MEVEFTIQLLLVSHIKFRIKKKPHAIYNIYSMLSNFLLGKVKKPRTKIK